VSVVNGDELCVAGFGVRQSGGGLGGLYELDRDARNREGVLRDGVARESDRE